jgi:retron-type reverse transcriptase
VAQIQPEAGVKRAGDLWEKVVSYPNLFAAAKSAAAGKRTRPDVAAFFLDLEYEIVKLHDELTRGTYLPGPYRSFQLWEPKPRIISAAPFRDRVVHHALTRVIEPVFERRFTADSYACRKGLGTHKAIAAARRGCRKHRYVLKCDIRKYFASIDHEILKRLLGRAVKCRRTLRLAGTVIDASNRQEEAYFYFSGDDLFTPLERRKGLPLGNQTSQFFANVYLNPMDHYVARELAPGLYVRYVDDFLIFADDKTCLEETRRRLVRFLEDYRLKLHPGKSRVYRVMDGVTFLGWRIFPDRMRLVRGNVVRFRRRLRVMEKRYEAGEIDWEEVHPRVRAWIAHAAHGDTWGLRSRIFARSAFRRGSAAGTAGRFLEQQCQEHPGIQP